MVDYSEILKRQGIRYADIHPVYQVGEIQLVQGWILHISTTRHKIVNLLETVIPYLVKCGAPFKLVQNSDLLAAFSDGLAGYELLGKAVSVYYPDQGEIGRVAADLIKLSAGFDGPVVLTDIHLGNAVYTRYGSFSPIMKTAANGRIERYIYNRTGQLVKDEYVMPYRKPKGIKWPFSKIQLPKDTKDPKLVGGQFWAVRMIKPDLKGSVVKGLRLRPWYRPTWCIVKQGRKCTWEDNHGRFITDRIRWQYEVQRRLEGLVAVPKALGYCEVNGNCYLALEFIPGDNLQKKITGHFDSQCWHNLTQETKIELIRLVSEAVDGVQRMHEQGFIHRDLSPDNFILNQAGHLVMIDLELTYSEKLMESAAPFTLGTVGFMSPEQQRAEKPTVAEDFFGAAALCLAAISGLAPVHFDIRDSVRLRKNINFFCGDAGLASVLAQSLSPNPGARQGLPIIHMALQQFAGNVSKGPASSGYQLVEREDIEPLVKRALNGLFLPFFIDQRQKVWHSHLKTQERVVDNENEERMVYPGLQAGVGGVLYLLNRAGAVGALMGSDRPEIVKGWEYVARCCGEETGFLHPGLHAGTAGLAIAIAEGILTGVQTVIPDAGSFIMKAINRDPMGIDLANGSAGQLLALGRTSTWLPSTFVDERSGVFLTTLLDAQHDDGHWDPVPGDRNASRRAQHTLYYGNPGILYSLMDYYVRAGGTSVERSITRGLEWMMRTYSASGRPRIGRAGLGIGATGVALMYIKAFQVFGSTRYREAAEAVLRPLPAHPLSSNFSQEAGLSGFGEVYLEAANVFGQEEWRERARWIASVLLHTYQSAEKSSVYWLVEHRRMPTADLLEGTAGLIHFLIRFLYPETISFPVIGDLIVKAKVYEERMPEGLEVNQF